MEDVARPPRPRRHFVLSWLPVALYAGLTVLASSIPGDSFPPQVGFVWRIDKVVHAGEFAVLGLLVGRALLRRGLGRGWVLLATSLAALSWGILDELHQLYVPGRSSDPFDVLADWVGGTLGAALVLILWRISWRSSDRSGA